MKIMSSHVPLLFRGITKALKHYNRASLLLAPCYHRNWYSFAGRISEFPSHEGHLIGLKHKNWNQYWQNGGALQVQTTFKANFHTTDRRQSIGPFLYAFFKPLVNIFGIIAGRRFKTWWVSLPPDRKKEIINNVKANTQTLFVGSTVFAAGCYGFYLIHLTEAPITKRKRFIVYSKKELHQISEIQNNFLQRIHEGKILSPSSFHYQKVDKIVRNILMKNQDLPEIRNSPWSVYVINDPLQKNVFVLPNGSIYVFTGIFDVCKSDDQLAFVLAHEISHVIMSHVEENISRGYFMEMLILIPILLFWATMPIEGAAISHYIINRMNHIMITLPFCRSSEMEADYVALQLIAKACYDVREASKFWRNMLKHSPKEFPSPNVEWLSTHPDYIKREKLLNNLMPAAIKLRQYYQCPPLVDNKIR